jgi:hypothetical protein
MQRDDDLVVAAKRRFESKRDGHGHGCGASITGRSWPRMWRLDNRTVMATDVAPR